MSITGNDASSVRKNQQITSQDTAQQESTATEVAQTETSYSVFNSTMRVAIADETKSRYTEINPIESFAVRNISCHEREIQAVPIKENYIQAISTIQHEKAITNYSDYAVNSYKNKIYLASDQISTEFSDVVHNDATITLDEFSKKCNNLSDNITLKMTVDGKKIAIIPPDTEYFLKMNQQDFSAKIKSIITQVNSFKKKNFDDVNYVKDNQETKLQEYQENNTSVQEQEIIEKIKLQEVKVSLNTGMVSTSVINIMEEGPINQVRSQEAAELDDTDTIVETDASTNKTTTKEIEQSDTQDASEEVTEPDNKAMSKVTTELENKESEQFPSLFTVNGVNIFDNDPLVSEEKEPLASKEKVDVSGELVQEENAIDETDEINADQKDAITTIPDLKPDNLEITVSSNKGKLESESDKSSVKSNHTNSIKLENRALDQTKTKDVINNSLPDIQPLSDEESKRLDDDYNNELKNAKVKASSVIGASSKPNKTEQKQTLEGGKSDLSPVMLFAHNISPKEEASDKDGSVTLDNKNVQNPNTAVQADTSKTLTNNAVATNQENPKSEKTSAQSSAVSDISTAQSVVNDAESNIVSAANTNLSGDKQTINTDATKDTAAVLINSNLEKSTPIEAGVEESTSVQVAEEDLDIEIELDKTSNANNQTVVASDKTEKNQLSERAKSAVSATDNKSVTSGLINNSQSVTPQKLVTFDDDDKLKNAKVKASSVTDANSKSNKTEQKQAIDFFDSEEGKSDSTEVISFTHNISSKSTPIEAGVEESTSVQVAQEDVGLDLELDLDKTSNANNQTVVAANKVEQAEKPLDSDIEVTNSERETDAELVPRTSKSEREIKIDGVERADLSKNFTFTGSANKGNKTAKLHLTGATTGVSETAGANTGSSIKFISKESVGSLSSVNLADVTKDHSSTDDSPVLGDPQAKTEIDGVERADSSKNFTFTGSANKDKTAKLQLAGATIEESSTEGETNTASKVDATAVDSSSEQLADVAIPKNRVILYDASITESKDSDTIPADEFTQEQLIDAERLNKERQEAAAISLSASGGKVELGGATENESLIDDESHAASKGDATAIDDVSKNEAKAETKNLSRKDRAKKAAKSFGSQVKQGLQRLGRSSK